MLPLPLLLLIGAGAAAIAMSNSGSSKQPKRGTVVKCALPLMKLTERIGQMPNIELMSADEVREAISSAVDPAHNRGNSAVSFYKKLVNCILCKEYESVSEPEKVAYREMLTLIGMGLFDDLSDNVDDNLIIYVSGMYHKNPSEGPAVAVYKDIIRSKFFDGCLRELK